MTTSKDEARKRFLQKRKDNHLCINCGKPLDRDGCYCISCLALKREEQKKDREFYLKNHICPRCRKEKLYGEETICISCSTKEYKATMRSRIRLGRDHYNKIHREWAKISYKRDTENGLCYRCRKRPADKGYKACGICREKMNEYKRIRYQKTVKIPRDERLQNGICFFCDNPVKQGYKVCEKHWKMNVEKSRSRKKKDGGVYAV